MGGGDKRFYVFDTFFLDTVKRCLFDRQGQEVTLMPKAFDTLQYLVCHSGGILEKDELMTAIWPDRIVEENNLNQNISAVRRALGEGHGDKRFIATIPGRGYKFVASVRALDDEADLPAALSAITRPSDKRSEAIRSLAVLPFKPMTDGCRDEALEMGIADILILKLGGGSLRIRPMAAARKFGSIDQDPLEAGRILAVEAVLDGHIQITNGRVRVTAHLLRVCDEQQLWAGHFDEELRDIFSIQDSISDKVAAALRSPLKTRRLYTKDVEAYQLYLRGNLHSQRLVLHEVQKGISYYQQAIAVDPSYALAYVGLANAYRAMVLTNGADNAEMMARSYAASKKAVELDDMLAAAWTSLALSDFWYSWDWKAAEAHYLNALELDPNCVVTHADYAHLLSSIGRHEGAISEVRRARTIDPLNVLINAIEGQILFFAGRIDEAERVLQATIDIDPHFWLSHLFLTRVYIGKGLFEQAMDAAQRARELTSGNAEARAVLGYVAAKLGKRDLAEELLQELQAGAPNRCAPAYPSALIHVALGNRFEALNLLEKAFQNREALMVFLKVDPKWDDLRSDAVFARLMNQMNFE
jgi:DNA-binding winged helix-turn-helix (wHTH) protein/Tfp pilus assembly protein PilF